MDKCRVIVVGYPKSGNTWVTRLTAELLACPVAGFLYEPGNPEIAIEGYERRSDFVVYKGHQLYEELTAADRRTAKIIYVVRDPRDVFLSGLHYFRLPLLRPFSVRRPRVLFRLVNQGIGLVNRVHYATLHTRYLRRRLLQAILRGDESVNRWLRPAWAAHVASYAGRENVLRVRYEDILASPLAEAMRIKTWATGRGCSAEDVKTAVERQSFARRRADFLADGERERADFLRRGRAGEWRTALRAWERARFARALGETLDDNGYPNV